MDDFESLIDDAVNAYNESAEPTSEVAEEVAAPQAQEGEAADVKPEETTPEKQEEDRLQALIDKKYGGDKDKFLDGLYESWNSTSKIAKELKELKAQLSRPADQPEEEGTSPQLDWFNKQAAKLEKEEATKRGQINSLVQSSGKLAGEIAELKGELKRADELDAPAIKAEIRALEAKQEAKQEKYADILGRLEEIELEKENAKNSIEWAKGQLKEARKAQLRERVEEQDKQKATLVDFVDGIKEYGTAFRIPKENWQHMANSIRGEIAVYLRSLGDDAEAIDIKAAVKERVAAYSKAMGKGGVAPKVTLGKTPTGTTAKPAGTTSSEPKVTNSREHAKYVDDVFKRFGLL